MRNKLKNLMIDTDRRRHSFKAMYVRTEDYKVRGNKVKRAMLTHLYKLKENEELADHIHIICNGSWKEVETNIEPYRWITFDAIITPYLHTSNRFDYALGFVENIKIKYIKP